MIAALLRHLLESSLCAAILLLIVAGLRYWSASCRHALLLCAALKFAVPFSCLIALGAQLRAWLPSPAVPDVLDLHQIISPSAVNINPHSSTFANVIFLSVWLSVAALLLSGWLKKLFAQIDTSLPISTRAELSLERMKPIMRVTRPVRLTGAREESEPRVCGLIHSTIVLPQTLSQRLAPGELDAVMLHELAHIRRWDNLTRALVHVLTCVFWFFPIVAWIERRIEAQSELACDELVLSCGTRPSEYLDGILKVCQFYVLGSVAGSSRVAGSNLKQRIEFIMSPRIHKSGFLSAPAVTGLLFSCFIAAAIITGFATNVSGQVQTTATTEDTTQPIKCLFGAAYPEGTVIRVGKSQEQMCVNSHGRPLWINTSDQARKRSQQVVSLPELAPFVCRPTAPNGKFCICKGQTPVIFSRNSTVLNSNHQVMTCGENGTWTEPIKKP